MSEVLRLTNSEMRAYMRCRRKWYLNYYRGLQPTGLDFNKPLSIGQRVHEVLSVYYQPGTERIVPLDYFRMTVDRDVEAHPEQESEIRKEADLCEAMLEGYFEWLAEEGEDSDLEVIEPEAEMEAPLEGLDATLLSKIDARVRRISDGKVFALEHKTVADLKKPVRKLQVDTQLLTEHLVEFLHDLGDGGSADAPKATGALYNMLRKVKRTASAKPPFFGREEVRHNVEELRNHWRHVAQVAAEIAELRSKLDGGADHHDVCYPSPTNDCDWDCEFKNVCLAGLFDDGSDPEPLLADLYAVGDPLERYRYSVGLMPGGGARIEKSSDVGSPE